MSDAAATRSDHRDWTTTLLGAAKRAGDLGTAVRRGDRALAIRLAVFSAFPVSVADRRVLALHRHLLRRLDVRRCAGDRVAHPGGAGRRLHRRRRAGAVDGALARGRQFPVADPVAVPGHSGAVLGGVRDHLVSRRRVSHLLHHGDDDLAGLHLSGARRLARDVAGSDGDGVQLPADADETVPGDDRAGDPAGHPDRLESQSRQRLARRGGRRTGRRHRRRRLSSCCSSSNCSTWPARWPGRCNWCSSC